MKILFIETSTMAHDKFHLSRYDFHTSAAGTFETLLEDTNFVDVTLACDDDKQLTAHKVILSANSHFFRNVFINNRHQHPLIYLFGVKFCDLQSLVKFMYIGEVSIEEKDLQSFLLTSETLKIEGLSSYYKMIKSATQFNYVKQSENTFTETIDTKADITSVFFEESQVLPFEEHDNDNLSHSESEQGSLVGKQIPAWENAKVFKIELGNDGKYPCGQCDHKSASITSLFTHKQSYHDQDLHSCDLCQYKATTVIDLSKHKRTHFDLEPVRVKEQIQPNSYFECDQCTQRWYTRIRKRRKR